MFRLLCLIVAYFVLIETIKGTQLIVKTLSRLGNAIILTSDRWIGITCDGSVGGVSGGCWCFSAGRAIIAGYADGTPA